MWGNQGKEEVTWAPKGSCSLGGVPGTPRSAPRMGPSSEYEGINGKRKPRARAPAPTLHPPGPLGGRTPHPKRPLQVLGSFSASVGKGGGRAARPRPHGAPCAPQSPGDPRSSAAPPAPAPLAPRVPGPGGDEDALPSPGWGRACAVSPLQGGGRSPCAAPVPSEVGEVLDETQLQHPLDGHRLVRDVVLRRLRDEEGVTLEPGRRVPRVLLLLPPNPPPRPPHHH